MKQTPMGIDTDGDEVNFYRDVSSNHLYPTLRMGDWLFGWLLKQFKVDRWIELQGRVLSYA